jgi:hypothetical protein
MPISALERRLDNLDPSGDDAGPEDLVVTVIECETVQLDNGESRVIELPCESFDEIELGANPLDDRGRYFVRRPRHSQAG